MCIRDRIHNVEKLTDNRFVNLYHVDATSVHNTPVSYFVASRATTVSEMKLKTGKNDPDGVIIYSLYGEKKDLSLIHILHLHPLTGAYITPMQCSACWTEQRSMLTGARASQMAQTD